MRRLLFLLLATLSGCAAPPAGIPQMACPHLPTSAPATRVNPLPPVSTTRLVLQPGHWDWVDGGYVWDQPAWIMPPWPSASKWQDGFWTPNGGGCAWTPGHFVL